MNTNDLRLSLIRRICGAVSVAGGCVGIYVSMGSIFTGPFSFATIISTAAMSVYLIGAISGVGIIERNDRALMLNKLFWIIQIPTIQSPLMAFSFVSGALFSGYVVATPLTFGRAWGIGSQFNFSILQLGSETVLGINFFAVLVLVSLMFIPKRRSTAVSQSL